MFANYQEAHLVKYVEKPIMHFQIKVIVLHRKYIIMGINFMLFCYLSIDLQSLNISTVSVLDIHNLKDIKT